jgi:hypothetical protein
LVHTQHNTTRHTHTHDIHTHTHTTRHTARHSHTQRERERERQHFTWAYLGAVVVTLWAFPLCSHSRSVEAIGTHSKPCGRSTRPWAA